MDSTFEVTQETQENAAAEDGHADHNVITAAPVADKTTPTGRFEPEPEFRRAARAEQTVEWDPKRIDPALAAFHNRYSSVCEQFRSLRARLLSMNTSNDHRVIAISSSLPQEGKSVTTVNLGLVMAEGGEHRTLIVDADFRRSSIGRMLGLEPQPGLAELIRREGSWEDLVTPTPFPNLKVLSSGTLAGQSFSELLGSTTTRQVLAELRDAFDYTFLDTPPVNTVSDVSMLAPYCDGAILVLEMRRTPEPTAQQAVRVLQANNVKILGCVVTRHDDRRTYYYDRYQYYYRGA